MALVVADRVQETTTTSGTGTLSLVGAVNGYQTFVSGIGSGNTTYYTIYDTTAQVWEVGIGTVTAGIPNTLSRTTVLSNSSGTTSPLNLAGNTAVVFCTYPSEKSINYDANGVATIGSTLGYSDTGIIGSFASTVAGYNQVILQNKSSATNASSNFLDASCNDCGSILLTAPAPKSKPATMLNTTTNVINGGTTYGTPQDDKKSGAPLLDLQYN